MVRKLGDSIYIDFCTHNPTTGSVADADSLPTCEVFPDDTDTVMVGVTVTKRTGKTGDYRIQIVATSGNGYAVGKCYNAVVSVTVGGVSAKAAVASFALDTKYIRDLQDPSLVQIANSVQDETQSGHTNVGTYGKFLDYDLTSLLDSTTVSIIGSNCLIPTISLYSDNNGLFSVNNISDGNTSTYVQNFSQIASDLTNSQIIIKTSIYCFNGLTLPRLQASALYGSNNSTNGSDGTQTQLTTFASASVATGWNDFTFVNSTAYRWYKISGFIGDNNTVLCEWHLYTASVSTTTLKTLHQTVANAVQDETRADHTNAGTFGKYVDHQISDITATGGASSTPAQIADAVLDELTGDHTITGSLGSMLDAKISTRATQTSVNSIPTTPLLTGDARLNALDTSISSRLATIDLRLNSLDTSISSRATQVSVSAIPTDPLRTGDARLNSLDTSISSRASQASVSAIPTNPLKTDDTRLNHLDVDISTRSSQTSVSSIPTNPLRTDDTRLNDLDAPVSSRSTYSGVSQTGDAYAIGNQILDRISNLSNVTRLIVVPAMPAQFLRADAGDRWMKFNVLLFDNTGVPMNSKDYDTTATDVVVNYNGFGVKAEFEDGSNLTLYGDDLTTPLNTMNLCHHSGQISLPQVMIHDSTGVYHFQVNLKHDMTIGNYTLLFGWFDHGQAAAGYSIADHHHEARSFGIVANFGVDQVLANQLQMINDLEVAGVKLPTSVVDAIRLGLANTTDVSSLQTSIGNIPTNPLRTNDTRLAALDTSISSRSSAASVSSIPTNPLLSNDARLAALDTSISSRASQASVSAIPTDPVRTGDSRLNALDTSISSRASQGSVSAIPVNPLRTDDTRLNNLDAPISSVAAPDVTLGDITVNADLTSLEVKLDEILSDISSIHMGDVTVGDVSVDLTGIETKLNKISNDISSIMSQDSSVSVTIDMTELDNKINIILSDMTDLYTRWDIGGSLYEMLHGVTQQNAGSGSRLIDVVVTGGDSTATIMGAQVHIYSGKTHVAFGNTDLDGKFTALLDDGTYQIVCAKVGYVFTNPATVIVSQSDTFTVHASSITIEPPNPLTTCRIWEWCFTTGGTPMSSISAVAKIMSLPYDCSGVLVTGETSIGIYDPQTGLVYWDFVHGARVSFEIKEMFVSVIRRIPLDPNARLSELLT